MYQITVTTLKCTRKTKWNFWNNLLNLLHTHTHTWIWIFNRCKHKAPLDSTAGGINECKYIRWFNFLFTPSPELNIILGHTRSSHSESLSLVLNCLAYYFYHTLATVETRWSVIDFKAKILLGGHYKGTPQESNLASGPCSQTGQISLHTQNLCTKNHSPRNSRQHFSKCRQRS